MHVNLHIDVKVVFCLLATPSVLSWLPSFYFGGGNKREISYSE